MFHLKNPEAPLGRKDWVGRSPRYRWSLTMPKLMILREWAECYFLHHQEMEQNVIYKELQGEILTIIEGLQKPLVEETEGFPLLEDFDLSGLDDK